MERPFFMVCYTLMGSLGLAVTCEESLACPSGLLQPGGRHVTEQRPELPPRPPGKSALFLFRGKSVVRRKVSGENSMVALVVSSVGRGG